MPPNTYTDISSLANTIYEDVLFVARENNLMALLAQGYNDRTNDEARKNAKYGSATINQIGETDDLDSQTFTPTVDQTLTPYEYGAQFFITDKRRESDRYAVVQDASLELGKAFGQKVDTLLVSTFSSLTGGTVGGTTTDLTWANIFAGIAKMRAAFAPQPWTIVLHSYQYYCLGTAVLPGVTVTNAPALQDAIYRQFYQNSISGVDIVLDDNITSGATAYGAIFSTNRAIALDWRRGVRIEPERDASRRGFELNLSARFAYGIWRPQFGVTICTAGTAPV
jgi:hypothetical protein